MSERSAERFRHLFTYECDSHARVVAALAAVSPARHTLPDFSKAVDLLAHVVACRWLWLFRMGKTAEAPADIFPRDVPLAALTPRLAAMETAWNDYLVRLETSELDRRFTYRSLDGRRFENSVEEILTQLYGHSLYHRGQIALRLRNLGAEPPVTDYVFYARRLAAGD